MKNKVSFLKSKFFKHNELIYGFFSRNGGISSRPFNTLNCSKNTKDLNNNVKKNIKKSLYSLNAINKKLIVANQYHSNKIIIIKNKLKKNYRADGFVTNNKNIFLGILTADCAPVFFYDPKLKIIGAAHIGWKGCLNDICKTAIKSMENVGSKKTNIESIIGPCINFKHYEVGRDLYLKYYKKNKKYKKFFIKKDSNKYLFNLSYSIEYQLKKLGIKRVIICNEDTYSNKRKYFSHRRSIMKGESNTGRMINIIGFLRK